MNLLALLYKRVVLRYTAKRQLIHQIDFVGIIHVLVLEKLEE